jgi:glycosyltransferase involved in cell wall biosynthesis
VTAAAAARPLHVLHVIDGIDVGGAELVLVRLVEALQRAGHRNTIIALSSIGPLGARLTAAGAEALALGFRRGRLPFGATRDLVRAVRLAGADLIQGWMYHGNLAATTARWLAGGRAATLWSVHNTLVPAMPMRAHTRLAFRLGAWLSWQPRAIVYVSAASLPQHGAAGFRRDRGVVIPNGIDCAAFRPRPAAAGRLRQALGVPPGVPLVGLFARWHPMKGHKTLFAAAGQLPGAGTDLHLVLAGAGIDAGNPALTAELARAGLAGRASLLGVRHDIEDLVAGLDLFVLPSHFGEAFPLVLVEAMASGVPCIATDTGDCRRIIADAGRVVPPGDARALARAMQPLLALPAEARRRIGVADRARVCRDFSLVAMAERYASLYARLVDGGGAVRR